MNKVTKEVNDYKAITRTIQHYINGARSAKGDEMKPAFHKDATVFVYVGRFRQGLNLTESDPVTYYTPGRHG